MRNAVRHFRAVPQERVPHALRSWTPLPAAPARTSRVERDRPSLHPRNRCRVMIAVEPVRASANATAPTDARADVLSTNTIALLLTLIPPIGVAHLWASPRYTYAAKIALTLFTAFTMLLAASLVVMAFVA